MTKYARIAAATSDFDALLQETLRTPKKAQLYLETALEEYEEDQNLEAFLLALRTLASVKGGLSSLAEKTNLSRQNLYRSLSKTGNPRLDTLSSILHGLGFRLSIAPLQRARI